jgi:predicted PurR-regulated permease PerM
MLNFIKKYSKWATIFVLGVALIAVYKTFDSFEYLLNILSHITDAIKPFIIAFVIAYLLNIPAKRLNRLIDKKAKSEKVKKRANAISIACVYILFILAILATLGALLPAIYRNLLEMYNNIPQLVSACVRFLNRMDGLRKLGLNAEKITQMITGFLDLSEIGKYASGLVSITSSLLDIFIALIASIYMLLDKDRILKGLNRIASLFSDRKKYKGFMAHCANVNTIFTQYIYARVICCLIVAVTSTILLLIMGEPYALLLGIFIGFMDMIPYFGSIISWAVSAVLMLISGGVFHALWCSILLLILQQIDGNVIAPKVMGTRLEISPLTIIVAVSVGGSLFGFIGMLISVPVVAILRAIATELLEAREAAQKVKKAKNNDETEDLDGDGEADDEDISI